MDSKEVLLAANACISKGDHEGFLAFCTEDVIWDFVGDTILEGKQAVRAYMKNTYLEPPVFEVHLLVSEGDHVTAVGEITIKDAGGTAKKYSYCDVWRLQAGLLYELRAFVIAL